MPRRSSASLSAVTIDVRQRRLAPPADLPEPARQAFLDLVLGHPPDHFQPTDVPIILAYCQTVVLMDLAAGELAVRIGVDDKPSPWIAEHGRLAKTLIALSRRLRVGPQARMPNNPTRAPATSYYERMALGADDVEVPRPERRGSFEEDLRELEGKRG
jgi:hypothetical protein